MGEDKGMMIYQSGLKLFKEHGPKKVSIDMIISDAGVGKGTFYNYYENKIALYEKIIDDIVDHGKSYMNLLVDTFPDPKERLMIDFVSSLDFFCGNDGIIGNLMIENQDFFIGKVNLQYLEQAHQTMITILIQDVIDDVFHGENELMRFTKDLFGFYKHAQQIRCSYKSEEEFRDFMSKLAYFFVEGIFSTYFTEIKDINYKKYTDEIDKLNSSKKILKDY